MVKMKMLQQKLTSQALLIASCFLAACATEQQYRPMDDVYGRIEWKDIEPSTAATLFRRGNQPNILAVKRQVSQDQVETEEITFANETIFAGENYLRTTISYVQGRDRFFNFGTRLEGGFNDQKLKQVFAQEFPTFETKVVTDPEHNRYGPFYYAEAAKMGEPESCVYAWQLIQDRATVLPPHIHAIKREYRFCGRADYPKQLLTYFNQSWMRSDIGVMPYYEEATLYRSDRLIPRDRIETGYLYPETYGVTSSGMVELPPQPQQQVTSIQTEQKTPLQTGVILGGPTWSDPSYRITSSQPKMVPASPVTTQRLPPQIQQAPLSLQNIEHVKVIQARLYQLGYYQAGIDGIWGRASELALANFRKEVGLSAVPVWDLQTQQTLFQ